ncbi:ribonuclease P protein component [Vagococcus luciliae]|uniref:Ribonuclease P protein component n=1 Tax=Vagococcus luciliae TaxID=2920380 RepID=A0ABY5NXY6_9ENTE|nr:ribonuclease P protein component [Vagococcus luciliae]UUV98392.1 Ribonuclease P protein component [Vagococcus luciliae]
MKKAYRIKKEKEFQKIIENKQSFANRNFIVYVYESPENVHFRVGLSVGKKVGNAVMRNRVKRLMRTSLYDMKEMVQSNYNIVLIARPQVINLSLDEVKKNIQHVFKLANLMK